jgi:hypothetical protein
MFEVSGATVSQWVTHLADVSRDLSDTERVDLIRALEDLKNVAAAAQATAAVDLDASQRAAQEQRGWPAARLGEGVASQVGLARRESPTKGAARARRPHQCRDQDLCRTPWCGAPIRTTGTGHTYRSRAPAPLGHVDYNSRTKLGYELIA